MSDEKKLQGTLYVLQRFFQCVLAYRALGDLKDEDHSFFRLVKGALMKDAVIDWCKVFGKHSENTHWKKTILENQHDSLSAKQECELSKAGHDDCTITWDKTKTYRDKFVAHLDSEEKDRPEKHTSLEPLFVMARVIYRAIYDKLNKNYGRVH